MPFKFEIKYRPGPLNVPADTLSQIPVSNTGRKTAKRRATKIQKVLHVASADTTQYSIAKNLHISYSHPGVSRFWSLLQPLKLLSHLKRPERFVVIALFVHN
jgi:hypothetical protein